MKHRCVFEVGDFEAGGQMIIRNSSPPGSPHLDFAISVAYKVGWRTGDTNNHTFLIAMSDGMISEYETEADLVAYLNSDPIGYRPMTDDEIRNILGEQGNRFN